MSPTTPAGAPAESWYPAAWPQRHNRLRCDPLQTTDIARNRDSSSDSAQTPDSCSTADNAAAPKEKDGQLHDVLGHLVPSRLTFGDQPGAVRIHSYSICLAVLMAKSMPKCLPTIDRLISIPADMPADVVIGPSSTHLTPCDTVRSG